MTDDLIQAIAARGYRIDQRASSGGNRLTRAQRLHADGLVRVTTQTRDFVEATVNHQHTARIDLGAGGRIDRITCTCQDWRVRGLQYSQPCKHILALALEVGDGSLSSAPAAAPDPVPAASAQFGSRVREAVAAAIADLASRVEALLLADEIPLLIGPTGCGKTSAIRQVAMNQGWGFEEVAGAPSFSDSDLVGLRTDRMTVPGVFARTFQRAQRGETMLLFLDEVTRFSARAMDMLMRPLQPTPAAIARAMGIACDAAVRLAEAPLWGQCWALASQVRIALACNPWGAALDPALVRRTQPLAVAFSPQVLALFTGPVQGAIEASWKATAEGQLPLPLEYQALLLAASPDDAGLFPPYLRRLQAVDPAAASGFATLLRGLGVAGID